ncbi:hypothetical protein CL644_01395 [bacterium]|jgi:hypothetical protein|nr:hypothetical protein [bacterium]|tara:strand:- start:869 stop:1252 length:384 start_codon:yes stop_codon:yes gene_type:complete
MMFAMTNWWQSILERTLQIKGQIDNVPQDILVVGIVFLVGMSAFGLGRLSNYENVQPAVRLFEAEIYKSEPMMLGGLYVASKKGSKYHFPWCSGARSMNEVNKIWFSSSEEAQAAGYAPAENCKGLQ